MNTKSKLKIITPFLKISVLVNCQKSSMQTREFRMRWNSCRKWRDRKREWLKKCCKEIRTKGRSSMSMNLC